MKELKPSLLLFTLTTYLYLISLPRVLNIWMTQEIRMWVHERIKTGLYFSLFFYLFIHFISFPRVLNTDESIYRLLLILNSRIHIDEGRMKEFTVPSYTLLHSLEVLNIWTRIPTPKHGYQRIHRFMFPLKPRIRVREAWRSGNFTSFLLCMSWNWFLCIYRWKQDFFVLILSSWIQGSKHL